MPQIRAFRGIRYDLAHVGSLRDVVAPPYDVIDASLQDQLYKRHPCNVVRLILNRPEPGDAGPEDRYRRAADFLRTWQRQGVLMTEPHPAVYVYEQAFTFEGTSYVRRGVMAAVRLERIGEGTIYPHEKTYAGPKQDRLRLMQATRVSLSPVFGLVPDDSGRLGTCLAEAVAGRPPLEATDDDGVCHRLWVVTDLSVIHALQEQLAGQPTFIADGHHRYETACTYRDELARELGELDPDHPAQYGLMMLVGMQDPGMVVLPTHRIWWALGSWTAADLTDKLSPYMEVEPVAGGPSAGRDVWRRLQEAGDPEQLGLYTGKDRTWIVARMRREGRERFAQRLSDRSPAWRRLGVAVLHHFVLEDLLGHPDPPRPDYLHEIDEVVDHLEQRPDASLAALVLPATVEDVRGLSLAGERMPQKSTYFYPKLLSGLVFYPLA